MENKLLVDHCKLFPFLTKIVALTSHSIIQLEQNLISTLILLSYIYVKCNTKARYAGRMKGQGGQLFNKGHILSKYIFTICTHSSEYIYTHAEQL